MDTGFYFGMMKYFGTRQKLWLPTVWNALIATELFSIKLLILWYVNFTSIEENPTLHHSACEVLREE